MSSIAKIRENPVWAYAAPLGVFMAFLMLPGFVGLDHPDKPWYIRAPEQWIYPLQTVVVAGVLAFFWKHYTFRPFRGFLPAVVLGVLTIGVWVLPANLYEWLNIDDPEGKTAWRWFGVTPRLDGFDPNVFSDDRSAQFAAIGMRFVRMACLVPFVEEIFWRGFLMRWLVDTDRDFRQIPFGTWQFKAVAITTALVAFGAHKPVDWIGALVFGSAMAWLAIRTKSLAACVVMHAVANFSLGVYVLVHRALRILVVQIETPSGTIGSLAGDLRFFEQRIPDRLETRNLGF